ncbi:MAG: DNA polymerase III subunit, partial [Elusimicrobiaceae bacterium]|nr:DNA polymerase III subunit [Elusimicrobiaceae bacterium]
MTFKEILGQEKASQELKKFIKAKRVPPSIIFYGDKGIGKSLVAKDFAKALNCVNKDFYSKQEFCGTCLNCTHINNNTHPDYIYADFKYQANLLKEEEEKQQSVKVETVRDLTKKSQQSIQFGGWRVIIIDNAETMSTASQNALLKFIEEPSPNTVWILIADKKFALLNTILSRSQAISFATLSKENIATILVSQGTDLETAQQAAKYANGSVDRALKILDVIDDIESLDTASAIFPFELAENMSRPLIAARAEANILIEILLADLQQHWQTEQDEKQKRKYVKVLKEVSGYKKAILRNVTPNLLVTTAFLEAKKLGI